MRRLLALHSAIALVIALLLAPFQHVHVGIDDDDHDDHPGHHEAANVHAHAVLLFSDIDRISTPVLTAAHDEHRAISLDSFLMTISAAPMLALRPAAAVLLFAPELRFAPVERIEVRGHDPPPRDSSPPRAPPA